MPEITMTPNILCLKLLFGLATAFLANRSKKNPYLWFLIGFFFDLIGLIVLFLIPIKKKKKKARRRAPRQQKQMPLLRGPQDKFWYYLDPSHTQIGPVSYEALLKELLGGKISDSTYIWNESETDWKLLKEFKTALKVRSSKKSSL